ncbi:MAG: hypothetical protein ACK4I8_08895, partial [Armatimonadota bacterium]
PSKWSMFTLVAMAIATIILPLNSFALAISSIATELRAEKWMFSFQLWMAIQPVIVLSVTEAIFASMLKFWTSTLVALILTFVLSSILIPLSLWELRRLDDLKTPKGYEEWLKGVDEMARKHLRMQ